MNRMILRLLAVVVFAFTTQVAVAQDDRESDPNWGATMESRSDNILLYSWLVDATRSRDYNDASIYMRTLIDSVPKATPRIYTYGVVIYKAKIADAPTPELKKVMADSLITVYDYWLKNFGDSPERGREYIVGQRAKDYMAVASGDRETVTKFFDESVAITGANTDPNLLTSYFQIFGEGYELATVEQDEFMTAYDRVMKVIDSAPVTSDMELARNYVEGMFLRTGIANCENIETMFKERIEANPTDEDLLQKTIAMLQRAKCSNDFYLFTAEKLYALRKTSDIAQALAVLYNERGQGAKAMDYLKEAIAAEPDTDAKARLISAAASMTYANGNSRGTMDFARQAIALNPDNGEARLLLAYGTWMSISASCTGFNRQTASWVMYDMLSDARRYFSAEPKRQREIDQQMAEHRNNFPSKEETFMRNMTEGGSYNFNCGGVSRTTTVRSKLD